MVNIQTAKQLIGKTCSVSWLNRKGLPVETVSRIHDVTFERMYGAFLVTDVEDVRLDRVLSLHLMAEDGSRTRVYDNQMAELAAAA